MPKIAGKDIAKEDLKTLQDLTLRYKEEVTPRKKVGLIGVEDYPGMGPISFPFTLLCFAVDVIYASTYLFRPAPTPDNKKVKKQQEALTNFLCSNLAFSKDQADIYINSVQPTFRDTLKVFEENHPVLEEALEVDNSKRTTRSWAKFVKKPEERQADRAGYGKGIS